MAPAAVWGPLSLGAKPVSLHDTAEVIIALLSHFLSEENTVPSPNIHLWCAGHCTEYFTCNISTRPHNILQLEGVKALKNLPKATVLITQSPEPSSSKSPTAGPRWARTCLRMWTRLPWALVCLISEWLFSNSLYVLMQKRNNVVAVVTGLELRIQQFTFHALASGTLWYSCKIR